MFNLKFLFLFGLLVLPAVIFTFENGNKMMSYAEEDPTEDEADVEGEADIEEVAGTEEEDEEEEQTTSPDAETSLLFVKPNSPPGSQLELPAGVPVEFLVGFRNKGEQDFIVESLRASFRYPMDFNFYIQNFSAIGYNKEIAPSQEATFAYSFIPSEAFAGRPFGLNINLAYRDAAGNAFQEAVFNETVQIVELEEGLDGETFFLYVFLAAGVVLLLVIGQQTLLSVGKKRTSRKSAPVETGTSNPNNVDYDWLPQQTLASLSKDKQQKSPRQQKSPKQPKSPKQQTQSPRQRKVKRSTGSE
ncbi:translocon-associated protein subunit alpha [Coccinella septempunctata]|uniref:translocon-associated protein subunit alpha n=1 Tax=Coccinella septempunctata TaxID=41139 RepID=UPI001D05CA98|nr:translocon-associated protein subunit alpha [Coccinella septempunctata]